MKGVLDAFALLAWMQEEAGAELVDSVLSAAERAEVELFLSVINAGEVYYRLAKCGRRGDADAFAKALKRREVPLNLVPTTNRRVWEAAEIKSRYALSYADAFAVALAREMRAPLISGDAEMLPLVADGFLEVAWVPRPLN